MKTRTKKKRLTVALFVHIFGLARALNYSCACRASEGPFTTARTAVPVQYVHVPKCGGTTIQTSIRRNLARHRVAPLVEVAWGGLACATGRPPVLQHGTVYFGHAPIGWCAAALPWRPLYVVSLREPLSLVVSLYDYHATCHECWLAGYEDWKFIKAVRHVQAAELDLDAEPSAYLDALLARNDSVAWGLAQMSQAAWLVPYGCDWENTLAVAVANLLRCDVVVVTKRLSEQLVAQLEYHAPWVAPFVLNVKNTAASRVSRTRQILSGAIQARLRESLKSIGVDDRLYSIGARLADLKTRQAREGSEEEGSPPRRPRPASCPLPLDDSLIVDEVQALLEAAPACVVPN